MERITASASVRRLGFYQVTSLYFVVLYQRCLLLLFGLGPLLLLPPLLPLGMTLVPTDHLAHTLPSACIVIPVYTAVNVLVLIQASEHIRAGWSLLAPAPWETAGLAGNLSSLGHEGIVVRRDPGTQDGFPDVAGLARVLERHGLVTQGSARWGLESGPES